MNVSKGINARLELGKKIRKRANGVDKRAYKEH